MSDLPKFRTLKYRVRRILEERNLVAHQKLPSERTLASLLGAHLATLRKALDELESEGVLYRKPRSGTYLAPQQRQGQVLVVTPGRSFHGSELFLRGVIDGLAGTQASLHPVQIFHEDFLRILPDLDFVYRDLSFVIFFRDFAAFRSCQDALREKGVASIFAGSSFHGEGAGDFPAVFWDEEKVARAAFRRLEKAGRPAFYLQARGVKVTCGRVRLVRDLARGAGLPEGPGEPFEVEVSQDLHGPDRDRASAWLREVAERKGFVFAGHDHLAARLLSLAWQQGHHPPEDVAVMGVDDAEFASLVHPSLTTVRIPLFEVGFQAAVKMWTRLLEGQGEIRVLVEPELVERESG